VTPADLTGAWRRASIAIGGGPPSEPASVVWLQVGEVYADLRVPLDTAGAQASFAGWTTWEAPTLRWIHDLDLDPSGGDDVGTLDRAGDELVERGTSAGPDGPVPYTEVWRRLPGSGPPHVARRREDGLGLLVRTGAHALAVLDERSLAAPSGRATGPAPTTAGPSPSGSGRAPTTCPNRRPSTARPTRRSTGTGGSSPRHPPPRPPADLLTRPPPPTPPTAHPPPQPPSKEHHLMTRAPMSRRDLLRRLGLSGAALALPTGLLAACGGSQGGSATAGTSPATTGGGTADLEGTRIKVATYGGFFEENFKTVYPDFTAETGIEVESVSEPGGDAWIVQLEQACARAASPPTCRSSATRPCCGRSRATSWPAWPSPTSRTSAWWPTGSSVGTTAATIIGVGAASWYITLVSNTDRVPESPTSWAALWDERWRNELALNNQASSSFLLDITAKTWFADEADTILTSMEGAEEVLAKLAEVKPNVKLWWRDEATAQQDYNSGEVSLGQFYHDITQYAASTGEPLRSVFPDEGAILDSGMWGITRTTSSPEACVAFIDWMCTPAVQKRLTTTLGTSPTLALEHLDLTAEEYANVSGPGPDAAIKPAYDLYQSSEDELNQVWSEQIFSG
jgi:putative spermidine/putrescine transport system substrate-binding protein